MLNSCFFFAEVTEQVAEALSSNGTSIGANGVAKHITHANGIKLEESLAQTSLPASQSRRWVRCPTYWPQLVFQKYNFGG